MGQATSSEVYKKVWYPEANYNGDIDPNGKFIVLKVVKGDSDRYPIHIEFKASCVTTITF